MGGARQGLGAGTAPPCAARLLQTGVRFVKIHQGVPVIHVLYICAFYFSNK